MESKQDTQSPWRSSEHQNTAIELINEMNRSANGQYRIVLDEWRVKDRVSIIKIYWEPLAKPNTSCIEFVYSEIKPLLLDDVKCEVIQCC